MHSTGLADRDSSLLAGCRAIIFDCDGTLADTMPAHYEAWQKILAEYQLHLSEDRFYALGGWPTAKIAELLVAESGQVHSAGEIAQRKEAAFEQMIHCVRPIEPVAAIVRAQAGQRPLAVATGAVRPICRKILDQIGLSRHLPLIVSCEDVLRHKPYPDIFLAAAQRLDIPPGDCVVFEDTDPGVEAARRAGMASIDVRGFFRPRRVTPSASSANG